MVFGPLYRPLPQNAFRQYPAFPFRCLILNISYKYNPTRISSYSYIGQTNPVEGAIETEELWDDELHLLAERGAAEDLPVDEGVL